jgi:hypothetical protein
VLLSILLACAPSQPVAPTAATAPAEATPTAATDDLTAASQQIPPGRPSLPPLPVAVYGTHAGLAVPLGGVPAVAPGDAPVAVGSSALAKWPSQGVTGAAPDGATHEFGEWQTTECEPMDVTIGAAALDPLAFSDVVIAPAGWAAGLVQWPTEPADDALRAQLTAAGHPTHRVVVANAGDLDGDGVQDRLVCAAGPQSDPDKPAASTVLWWGADLAPVQGFDFNGAVEATHYLPTPAGPLVILRSNWMGGSGVHLLVVEGSQPRALGEWACGT